jgi:glycosyltransferase involved in cell wall biosynthesis
MELQKKKKILLLGDDFRLPSGIGTVSKEIIFNTVHKFDWVQIGGALQHPEAGQFLDISKDVQNETSVMDASVKLIPYNGYGDRTILFAVLNQEKPDAILHFTDPRYWTWLYQIEHEVRTTFNIPITYYSIWDDLPFPMWNAPFYASCDMIMGISKQSDIIHQQVLEQNGFDVVNYDDGAVPTNVTAKQIVTGYVPHGLNHKLFKPDTKSDAYKAMLKRWKTDSGTDFIVMWNNRNIRRKQPGDLILAFKHFVNQLPEEQRSKVALLMHTQPVDDNGTDLYAIWKTLAPECKILFSEHKLSPTDLNALYNVVDVVVNIGSNEGWGLSSTEAMLTGTPIINNVTGGLQDQCGFEDKDGNWLCFDGEFTTNHMGRFKKHGIWAKPVFPANRSLQGSPATPYIFDDRVNFEDVGDAIMYWYNMTEENRAACGYEGRQWALANGLTSEQMGNKMIEMFNYLFESKRESRPRYTLHKVEPKKYKNTGIVTK